MIPSFIISIFRIIILRFCVPATTICHLYFRFVVSVNALSNKRARLIQWTMHCSVRLSRWIVRSLQSSLLCIIISFTSDVLNVCRGPYITAEADSTSTLSLLVAIREAWRRQTHNEMSTWVCIIHVRDNNGISNRWRWRFRVPIILMLS